MGRYYAMDRDNNYDRVKLAYDVMTTGEGKSAVSGPAAVQQSYDDGKTDEFVMPTAVIENGQPAATIKDGDSIIFFNFRPDRAREMTRCFCDDDFKGFDRKRLDVKFVCFSDYDATIPNKSVAFHKISSLQIHLFPMTMSDEVCHIPVQDKVSRNHNIHLSSPAMSS